MVAHGGSECCQNIHKEMQSADKVCGLHSGVRNSGKPFLIALIVAGTACGTAGAVAAAGGLSLFFVVYHAADNQSNHCQKDETDKNCTDIRADPLQHKNHSISEH